MQCFWLIHKAHGLVRHSQEFSGIEKTWARAMPDGLQIEAPGQWRSDTSPAQGFQLKDNRTAYQQVSLPSRCFAIWTRKTLCLQKDDVKIFPSRRELESAVGYSAR